MDVESHCPMGGAQGQPLAPAASERGGILDLPGAVPIPPNAHAPLRICCCAAPLPRSSAADSSVAIAALHTMRWRCTHTAFAGRLSWERFEPLKAFRP